MANQQGKHLAAVFSSSTITGDADKDAKLGDKIAPFRWVLRTGTLVLQSGRSMLQPGRTGVAVVPPDTAMR